MARSLRSGSLRTRGVRTSDQAKVLIGLDPHTHHVLLLTGPPRDGEPVGALEGELRGLLDSAGDALVYIALAAATDEDVVRLLDAGADDVITGPVRPAILAARIRARRRRGPATVPTPADDRLGDLVVDTSARRCLIRDRPVALRAKELDLLDALAANAGHVVSRSRLMSLVWDEHWFRSTKTLDVTMAGLRRQLREVAEAVGGVVPEITTIRGVGYRLDPPGRVDLARVR